MGASNTALTGSSTDAPAGTTATQETDSESFSVTASPTPASTDWLVGTVRTSGDTISQGTNTKNRNFNASYQGISDSDGVASPTALAWTVDQPGSNHYWSGCIATISVASAAVPPIRRWHIFHRLHDGYEKSYLPKCSTFFRPTFL